MPNIEYNNMYKASEECKIHDWVLSFLLDSGNNHKLAKKLSEYSQFHFGPVNYPISDLINLVGPGKMYHEEQSVLDSRVDAMIDSINNGWKPAPLIVTNIWNDSLEIADGCHRQMALKKIGITKYQIIFYFKDQYSLDNFTQEYMQYLEFEKHAH